MINKKQNNSFGRFLSLVLRHKPEQINITLDNNGWTNVDELIKKMNNYNSIFNINILKHIVKTDSKNRFVFNYDKTKIRASQGHSLNIDLNYEIKELPKILQHGTCEEFLVNILKTGIEKRKRQYVHLSSEIETAYKVGKRHGVNTIYNKSQKHLEK